MITVREFAGRPVGVFGLGKAGEATVASLLAGNAIVYAWDDSVASRKALASGHPQARILPVDQWPWQELAAFVPSPGIPLTHPAPHAAVLMAKEASCPILGDIELLCRACPQATFVGITGTNGKSTTTTLIAHILKRSGLRVEVGGNLGTPALALQPLARDEIYVLETSSYQLDLLQKARFNIAVLLNLTPDHLDRHGDMEGYINAKLNIFARQGEGDTAIVAVDDDHTSRIAQELAAEETRRVIRVSATREILGGVYATGGVLCDATRIPPRDASVSIANIATLTGRHNWQNAAAAAAVALRLGVSFETISDAMRTFPGLAHRLEQVATIGGVRFINDSKATNADATANALEPYATIYWILGGKAKAGGIESLREYFPRIAHAYLIGDAASEFAATLGNAVAHTQCGTLENAVRQAAALAMAERKPGAVVLLSPACASFDQFKNFEARGERFRELVSGLNAS